MSMTIFKCPHCGAEYEMMMASLSFRQRSYAVCQKCWKTMYSWDSARVPRFTLCAPANASPAQALGS